MNNKLPQPTQINRAEKLRGNIIFFIIGFFIIHLFISFLDFLFKPLRALSPKETADKVDVKIEEKKTNRLLRRTAGNHPDDPMEQFYLRFVEKSNEYKKDSDNEAYFAWFQEWKSGNIIDSNLIWAPDILDEYGEIRENFIHYMKIQLALHKKASFVKKMQFINTIFRFYPELSASMRGLEEDLAQYGAEVDEESAEAVLEKEIRAFGLSQELAEYLMDKDINAQNLRKEAVFLKDCTEKGYDADVCICALENYITHDIALKVLKVVISDIGLPGRVAIAFLNKEINQEQLTDIGQFMLSICEQWGTDIFEIEPDSDKTHYDGFVDAKLKEYRGKKVLKHLNGES